MEMDVNMDKEWVDKIVPAEELNSRLHRFRAAMDAAHPDWETALFISKVNQYYFTGTMQDGMLLVPRDGEAVYWVYRSFERAVAESRFPVIKPMRSYREAAAASGNLGKTVYMETKVIPVALFWRLQKYFPFAEMKALDREVAMVRAVKSPYELARLQQAGEVHRRVLEERVPELLKEGMSEAELAAKLYTVMIEEGHHGLVRFRAFDTDMAIGYIGFGKSSIYPTNFNGPGGNRGLSPAAPVLGSRERRLKKGDLVFVDVGCGVDGYHTDKTMTYVFGGSLPKEAVDAHKRCVEIQNETAALLKPGAVPAEIYRRIMDRLSPEFLENFMGYGAHSVKFLGHGTGLQVDELPVIAEGFEDPLAEGMVMALEPKKGFKGVGMVGIENTFLVTPGGGRSITGDHPGLLVVD
jgi:Xaa-Pro dipeptidase